MMNKIYDFSEIQNIRARQNKLIIYYFLYALCFIAVIFLCSALIKNNLLLTVIFAPLLLCFILFSICYFKIKYGILKSFSSFLEDLETGRRDEIFGSFENKNDAILENESFDVYVFSCLGERREFLVHKSVSINFEVGSEYHLTYVGKYLLEWKK